MRGENLEKALEKAKVLEEPGIVPHVHYSVHPMTLKKLAKETAEQGQEIDFKKLGVWHFKTAKVTKT